MIKIPHDAEQLTQKLPQEILDEILIEMVIWEGLAFVEMGTSKLTKKQIKKSIEQSMIKHVELLREAKAKLDKKRGV